MSPSWRRPPCAFYCCLASTNTQVHQSASAVTSPLLVQASAHEWAHNSALHVAPSLSTIVARFNFLFPHLTIICSWGCRSHGFFFFISHSTLGVFYAALKSTKSARLRRLWYLFDMLNNWWRRSVPENISTGIVVNNEPSKSNPTSFWVPQRSVLKFVLSILHVNAICTEDKTSSDKHLILS